MSISRRTVLVGGVSVPMAATLASCRQESGRRGTGSVGDQSTGDVRRGRLTFRPPARPKVAKARTGRFAMSGAAGGPPAELYVPEFEDREPLRLVVMLHGAGGVAQSAGGRLRREAESPSMQTRQ